MELGKFELDNVYCADSYKAIKQIPDKSIDCIYTDIPYLYNIGDGGSSPLAQRINTVGHTYLADIKDGIDFDILNDFVRVMKKINIFIWCSKLQIFDIMKYFIGGVLRIKKFILKYLLGIKLIQPQQQIILGYPILNIVYTLERRV